MNQQYQNNQNGQNNLAVIEHQLQSESVKNQLMLALDLNPDDESSIREASKYIESVKMQIMRTKGTGGYTDLTSADPQSIVSAFIDAANFKLQIDGRNLCYLEKRAGRVSLQINANGFVAKIKEQYPDARFIITPHFQGDPKPRVSTDEKGNKTCKIDSENPFGKIEELEGIFVQISYTDHGGEKISDVQPVSIGDLRVMASKSKSNAWKDFPLERMKTAALKRACKWHFRQNATLQAVIDYDNKQNFDVEQPASRVRPTIVDNINAATSDKPEKQEPPIDDSPVESEPSEMPAENVTDVEFEEIPFDQNPAEPSDDVVLLIDSGDEESAKGVAAYTAWIATLSDADKDLVRDRHKSWTAAARAADAEAQQAAAPAPRNDAPPI